MKRLLYIILIIFTLKASAQSTDVATATTSVSPKLDFSGTFLINKSKTDFGKAPSYVIPVAFSIVQTGDTIIISRMYVASPGGQNVLTDTLSTGRTSKIKSGMVDYTSVLYWNKDKNQFTINRQVSLGNDKVVGTIAETCALEENGKTLVLDKSVQGGVHYNIKGYYDKQ